MITLAAYGIRKAYKKQQARKARKEELERENQEPDPTGQFDHLQLTNPTPSYLESPHRQPINWGIAQYSSSSPSRLTQGDSAYSASEYSQKSSQDPREEMRQYQAYIQRQSHDFRKDIDPPTYDFVVGQDPVTVNPLRKSAPNSPTRTETMGQIQESRHTPQGPDRFVELDSSSEASPSTSERIPLPFFHPRGPILPDNQTVSPAVELPTEYPEQVVSRTLDDQLQASLDELVVELSRPPHIGKSNEVERSELSANRVPPLAPRADEVHEQKLEAERPQLKRPRSESGSEIESEDNEEVIVRFGMADRTKRPFSKRISGF